jgi:hypothetical protein
MTELLSSPRRAVYPTRIRRGHVLATAAGLVGIILFCGCGTTNVGSGYSLTPDSDSGLAVASLTLSGVSADYTLTTFLRGVDSDFDQSVPVLDASTSQDWDCPFFRVPTPGYPCGRLAVIELSPGEYEFYSWRAKATSRSAGTTTVIQPPDFSRKFTVLAGKAVYLGNIHMSPKGPGPNKKSPAQDNDDLIWILDTRERDLALLFDKYPKLSPDDVVVSILPN